MLDTRKTELVGAAAVHYVTGNIIYHHRYSYTQIALTNTPRNTQSHTRTHTHAFTHTHTNANTKIHVYTDSTFTQKLHRKKKTQGLDLTHTNHTESSGRHAGPSKAPYIACRQIEYHASCWFLPHRGKPWRTHTYANAQF